VQLEGRDAFGRNSGTAIVQGAAGVCASHPAAANHRRQGPGLRAVDVHPTGVRAGALPGQTVRGSYPFRVTRNSDLFLDEEEIKNLRTALAESSRSAISEIPCGSSRGTTCRGSSSSFSWSIPARRRRPVPRGRTREPGAPDAGPRSGRQPHAQVPAFVRGRPEATGGKSRSVQSHPESDVLLHHPFSIVQPRDRLPGAVGRRPQRGRDQADRVPHRHRLGSDEVPDRRRASAARKSRSS